MQDVDSTENITEEISARSTTVKVLKTKTKVINSQFGSVINARDNATIGEGGSSIGIKTYYDNYKSSGILLKTYTGDISSQDEKVTLKVNAKSGYNATIVPNVISSGSKYLEYDTKNLISSNLSIGINPINTTK